MTVRGVRAVVVALAAAAALTAGCAAAGEGAAAPSGSDAASRADDPALAERLDALLAGFDGRVGVFVEHLPTGSVLARSADETFPSASLVKVPILLALYERIEAGELDPHEQLAYDAERSRGGEDLLAGFVDGHPVALSKLIHLMVGFSDNTASVWLQELAGGGAGVNAWLAANGYGVTRVNSRTAGREDDYRRWGWGQTTPREMVRMLVAVRRGEAVAPRADEEMYRVLCRAYWDAEALGQIPPWVQAASKQGAINASRSEAVLVNAPGGDYAFCVITDEQTDRSWSADNAGFQLLRDVSRVLWEHFEGDAWRPAAGVEAWR